MRGQSLDIALEYLSRNEGCVDVALYLMTRGCGSDEDKAKLLCGACQWGKLGVVKELVEQYKVGPKSECDDLFFSCVIPNAMHVELSIKTDLHTVYGRNISRCFLLLFCGNTN